MEQFNCSNAQWNKKSLVFIMLIFAMAEICGSCYLKNCPLGKREQKSGKRTPDGDHEELRTCPRCGPDGAGRCVGPYTCCMTNGGCIMSTNSVHTAPCAVEQDNPIPCIFDDQATHCAEDGQGLCASNALCCTEDICTLSFDCLHPKKRTLVEILQGE